MEEAHKKDAIPNMRKRLLDGVATEEEILAVEKAVEDEMEAAYQLQMNPHILTLPKQQQMYISLIMKGAL